METAFILLILHKQQQLSDKLARKRLVDQVTDIFLKFSK
jgi:hypothetical protein